MKTKFKDEFDKFDTDMNIDETTVIKNLGIDPENIKNKVMHQIRSSKTKKNSKRFTVWLVAAAAAVAVVGTTVIATTGLYHPDFTPIYKGDVSVLEVIGTDEFSFESDSNSLNAEFLGMVCTERNIIASVALTKTDGTVFTEADGILAPEAKPLNSYISTEDTKNTPARDELVKKLKDIQKPADYPYVYFMQGKNNEIYNAGFDALYYDLSEDRKSMNIYISSPLISNKTDEGFITLTSEYTYAFTYNEQLCAFNTMNEVLYSDAASVCENKGLDIEKDCKWKIEGGRYCLYDIKKEKLPLKFDMTYKAEYMEPEIINTILDSENSPNIIKPDRTADLTVSPTMLSITSNEIFTPEQIRELQKTGYYKDDQLYIGKDSPLNYEERISAFVVPPKSHDDFNSIDYEHSMIILTDGSIKYLLSDVSGLDWNVDDNTGNVMLNEELKFFYSDIFIDGDTYIDVTSEKLTGIGKTTVTDPKKIAKIVINNETIYTKKGYENISVPKSNYTDNFDKNPKTEIDLSIPVKGKPNMKKYRPYQNTIDQINLFLRSLDSYYCTSQIINNYINVEDNPNYISTNIILDYEGKEEELKDILSYFIGLEEKNIFITSIRFSKPNEEGIITMKTELINPYATPESGLSIQEASKYILSRWNSADRKNLIERFFNTHTDIETDEFSISIDKNMDVPEIPEPSSPITMPEHKPTHKVSIDGFGYKKWTKNELNKFAESLTDNVDILMNESVNDIDNTNFYANEITIHFSGSKDEIMQCIRKIVEKEKENLFIKNINTMYMDDTESVIYEFELTIENPYYTESSDITENDAVNYILLHYGSANWYDAIDAGIGLYSDISNVIDTSMYIREHENTKKPVFYVSIHETFKSYNDVMNYRNSFENNKTFTLGDEIKIEKIPWYMDDSIMVYDTITILSSDKFIKN